MASATQFVGSLGGTNPNINGKIQESDGGGTWTDVPGATFATVINSDVLLTISFSHTLQYLRYVATVTGTSPLIPVSVTGEILVENAPVDSVLTAFRATMAASPSVTTALSGGLWANEVPEQKDLPYGFIELLDSRFMWTTEDFHIEVAKVRLHIYAIGGEACESLTRQVRQLYDWNNLTFATDGKSSTCQTMPTDYCVQSEFARLKSGDIVYQGTVEYEVMINRNILRG